MPADWNPELYRRYEDQRTRPARDLLDRIPLDRPKVVYDLGCGPGNSTELLVERFPSARVIGTDNSEAMLESARERLPAVHFEFSDIAAWQPPAPPDLIYTNAALQWVGDHRTLFPRLLAALAPGGVLAVQMPDNRDESTHRLMREVASVAPWSAHIGDVTRLRTPQLALGDYYDLLAADAAEVDIWRTAYQHPMESAEAIVEWVRGTGLRPFIDPLPAEERTSFLAEYTRRIDTAYMPRSDGRRLLAFPRLFIVAQRKT
jgi:trans-aconitate 2-methyltransferase